MVLSPSYSWTETDAAVTITAQCPGATPGAADVFSSPHYVSLNSAPYFLELDLAGEVNSGESVATVRRGEVTLWLKKRAVGPWGALLVDLPRPERLKRRAASRAAAEQEGIAQAERKKSKTWNESRYVLGEQMDTDRTSRDAIERAKAAEKADEAEKLRQWQSSVARPPAPSASSLPLAKRASAPIFDEDDADDEPRIVEMDEIDELPPPLMDGEDGAPPTGGLPPRAVPASRPTKPTKPKEAVKPPATAKPVAAPLPPPRRTGAVAIKFTPKLLPGTPPN